MPTDRIPEEQHGPVPTSSLPTPQGVLVFAPHPDDEVYGCGGILCLWARQGIPITVVVCTAGTEASPGKDPHVRQEESRCAAGILGYASPVFWDLQDREITYGEGLVRRLVDSLKASTADWILAPAVSERHPDHQALSLAVAEAVRRVQGDRTLAFYEVSAPLVPNWLVDITRAEEAKNEAMRCFVSQEAQWPYGERIRGLNRYRAYPGGADCRCAEAFFVVRAEDLQQGLGVVYRSFADQRASLGAGLDPSDLPLVSVIIRSMDRPSLAQALGSLADQTYANLQVVVVNAKGGSHGPVVPQRPSWDVVVTENRDPLDRSRAANVGLAHAQGRYVLFLDDDDLLLPDHIARLMEALSRTSPETPAAYTGVRVVDEKGAVLFDYDQPWSFSRLLAANYIPNMAVLFRRSLVEEKGCRFDESLEVLEDWDFLLQLAQYGNFIHVPGISAIYRYGLGTSGLSKGRREDYYRTYRARVLNKWFGIVGMEGVDQCLYELSQRLDGAGIQVASLTREKENLRREVGEKLEILEAINREKVTLEATVKGLQKEVAQVEKTRDNLQEDLEEAKRSLYDLAQEKAAVEAALQEIVESKFWKATRPLRALLHAARTFLRLPARRP